MPPLHQPLRHLAQHVELAGVRYTGADRLSRARRASRREVVGVTRSPGDEPAVGNAALFSVAVLGLLAPMLCSWVLARRRVPGRSRRWRWW